MMNKYWKLIGLLVIIVLGIGTFYIYKQVESGSLPEYGITKESGSESELTPVTMQGLVIGDGNVTDYVEITKSGAVYGQDQSYIQMYLESGYNSNMIKNLQEKYRNFMRKKNYERGFFENEELLVYADIDVDYSHYVADENYRFQISILDKEGNKRNSINIDVPNHKNLSSIYVEDVQVNNNMLYILTGNDVREKEEYHSAFRVYQFDLDTNELVGEHPIVSVPYKENTSLSIGLLSEVNRKEEHDYAVIHHREHKEGWYSEEGVSDAEPLSDELIAYDFSKNESKKLDIPDDLQVTENMNIMFDGSMTYFMDASDGEVMVSLYDIHSEKVEKQFTVDIPATPEHIEGRVMESPVFQIEDDKLYILTGPSIGAHIKVMDLQSGDILYDGVIEEMDEKERYELQLRNLELDVS